MHRTVPLRIKFVSIVLDQSTNGLSSLRNDEILFYGDGEASGLRISSDEIDQF